MKTKAAIVEAALATVMLTAPQWTEGAPKGSRKDYKAAMKQAEKAYANRDFRTAELMIREAIAEGERFKERDGYLSESLSALAKLLSAQDQFEEALPPLRRSVEIMERIYSARDERLLSSNILLADLLRFTDRFEEAEKTYISARDVLRKTRGAYASSVGACAFGLGIIYAEQGKLDEAETALSEALEAATATVPRSQFRQTDATNYQVSTSRRRENEHGAAATTAALARVYLARKKPREAEAAYEKLLNYAKKHFGDTDARVVSASSELAELRAKSGDIRGAETQLLDELARQEKLDAKRRTTGQVALCLRSLSRHHLRHGSPDKADDYLSKYLRRLSMAGPEADDLDMLKRLLAALVQRRDGGSATSVLDTVMIVKEKTLSSAPAKLADFFLIEAEIHTSFARTKEALAAFKRGIALKQSALGADHPSLAEPLRKLAETLYVQPDYRAAATQFTLLANIQKKHPPADADAIGVTYERLALCLEQLGDHAALDAAYAELIATREKQGGPDDINIALALTRHGQALLKQNRFADAEPLLDRALQIEIKTRGPEHPQLLSALGGLYAVYRALGADAKMEPVLRRQARIYEKDFGLDVPVTRSLLKQHAALLRKLNRATEADAIEARLK